MRGEKGLREALAGLDPEWIEEAVTRAADVPDTNDPEADLRAISEAAVTVIRARTDAVLSELARLACAV